MESFCQKDCHICPRREALDCMGCRPKYDAPGYPGCDIAQCCKAKGHANCGTCQFSDTCDKLSRRDAMPDEKPRNLRRAAELKDSQIARAAFLGRWLWALFWLILPSGLGAIVLTEPVLNLFPDLLWVGIGLQIMTVLCSCGIQLPISRYSRHFRNGVWFALPSYCVLLPFLFLPLETKGQAIVALLFCALSAFLSMLSIRQQIAVVIPVVSRHCHRFYDCPAHPADDYTSVYSGTGDLSLLVCRAGHYTIDPSVPHRQNLPGIPPGELNQTELKEIRYG